MASDQTTHWEGCEREHHACALAVIDALRTLVAKARETVRVVQAQRDILLAQQKALLTARDALRTRLAQMETDIRDAAGELRVEMPQPGTVTAKLLSANVLLRRERDAARRWRDEAVAACAQRGCASRERRLTEAVVERDAAQARVRALAEAVERFEGIGHVADCDRDIDENKCDANPLACPGTHRACTCGWSDVEAALDALAAPERGDG